MIYGIGMAALHFCHKQFLSRRSHGNKHYIRTLLHNIGDQSLALGIIFEKTVSASYDADVGIFLFQFLNRLPVYIFRSTYYI